MSVGIFIYAGDFVDYMPIIMLVAILIILSVIQKLGKNKKPVLRAFVSMIVGLCSLVAVNITSFLTGVSIPVSIFTVGVSASCGIPGVTLLLFLNLL